MDILKPKDVIKLLKISSSTLRRWDKDGILVSRRNSCNRRYYTMEDINKFKGISNKKNILYARVSGKQQIDDLKNQKSHLLEYALNNNINDIQYLEDIGSGMNFKRKNFIKIMEMVENEEISSITISFKDRLVRFGFEWFQHFCNKHSVKINIINENYLSPEEELVDDLVSIIHVFSSKIYGLRKYSKKEIEDVLNKERNLFK